MTRELMNCSENNVVSAFLLKVGYFIHCSWRTYNLISSLYNHFPRVFTLKEANKGLRHFLESFDGCFLNFNFSLGVGF